MLGSAAQPWPSLGLEITTECGTRCFDFVTTRELVVNRKTLASIYSLLHHATHCISFLNKVCLIQNTIRLGLAEF
jgi:hypothetical protein